MSPSEFHSFRPRWLAVHPVAGIAEAGTALEDSVDAQAVPEGPEDDHLVALAREADVEVNALAHSAASSARLACK